MVVDGRQLLSFSFLKIPPRRTTRHVYPLNTVQHVAVSSVGMRESHGWCIGTCLKLGDGLVGKVKTALGGSSTEEYELFFGRDEKTMKTPMAFMAWFDFLFFWGGSLAVLGGAHISKDVVYSCFQGENWGRWRACHHLPQLGYFHMLPWG